MNGLLLSERYYKFYGKPMIEKNFPDYLNRMAIGLVGEGSECFGFDDELSMDHDWGPAFSIWLNEQDYADIGKELQLAYDSLPIEFAGLSFRKRSDVSKKRVGVFETKSFYQRFIGSHELPSEWEEWIEIRESELAACTNGKIFHDEFGEFTHFRNELLNFYPHEVRLKKIADRCFMISREGQYNYMRSVYRNDIVAVNLAESKFIEASISLAFLINWRYMPYYKWMHRSLYSLPVLGQKLYELIKKLSLTILITNPIDYFNRKSEIIETICGYFVEELNRQQLSCIKSSFLLDHSLEILKCIENPELRDYNIKDIY